MAQRIINAYEVYYRRDGRKQSRLFTSERQAQLFRSELKKNNRKFLGARPLQLAEVEKA